MTKGNNNQKPAEPIPMSLPEIGDVSEQFKEAFKVALGIPSADFPADKKVAINLGWKVVLVPELTIHITKNECMGSVE